MPAGDLDDTVLPTSGEVGHGLVLGVARGAEADGGRPPAGEAPLTIGMGERRRRDFLAGRLAARRALAALGVPPAAIGRDGPRPRFPIGVQGSIAHSHGVGVAVARRAAACGGVGVDLELGRLSLGAARKICAPEELAWVMAAAPAARADRATALFSAKESVHKSLPAAVQPHAPLGAIAIAPAGDGFTARIPVPWPAIAGGWRHGPAVVTWAAWERPCTQSRLGNAIG